ncbi:MAG: ABC transporter permease, partial [Bacteroidota bacterium]
MNLAKLSWKYTLDRPLNTFLNVLLFGFGVAIILVLLLVSTQMENALTKNAKGINLVVAAKGSPLQIILCNIYHIDFPTGNIALEEAIQLSKNRLIKKSIPLALGDSYRNYRIVGTTHDYANLYQVNAAEGKLWGRHEEVVLGANVAAATKMAVGDEFATEHGMQSGGIAHEEHAMTVVGILERSGSVVDNLILTSVESVWEAHGTHHDHDHDHAEEEMETALGLTYHPHELAEKEITSMILQYAGPMAAVRLPRMINDDTNMQAASPAFETARLFTLIGTGVEVVNGFAYLIIFIAGLSIFISLYNSLKQRTYDLAIMRAMGASSRFLFLHVIVESV